MRVFISYSSANRRIVEELKDDLENAGYEVWYDQRLSGGQEWWDEIIHQIQICDVFLFAATSSSLNSDPCEREYTYAIALNKAIVPVCIADVDTNSIPISLKKLQVISYNIADSRKQLLELIRALNQFTIPQKRNIPNALPMQPEIPFSAIDKLADQIFAEPSTFDEQISIWDNLKRQLSHSEYSQSAWQLLKQFYNQEKLFAKVKDEIREFLPSEPDNSHLDKYVKLEPRTFEGHAGAIKAIVFSPDNSKILTGSSDFRAMLWDSVTGRPIQTYKAHTDEITCVDFSSDGQYVVTGSKDSTARLWSVSSVESIKCFEGHTGIISSIKISPNSQQLLTGSNDKTARLYDIKDGSFVREFKHPHAVTAIAFSRDGRYVFTAIEYDNSVICWDPETGNQIQSYIGHKRTINSISCSQNGEYVLTGSDDGSARVWEMATGKFKDAFAGHKFAVHDVKFSLNQSLVITTAFRLYMEYRVWDFLSGKLILNKSLSSLTVDSVIISDDCQYLAVGVFGEQSASILRLDKN